MILEQYLDEHERLASLTDRIASTRILYDNRGNRIRIEYMTAALQPVETAMGYSTVVYAYDAQDRCISETYLDVNILMMKTNILSGSTTWTNSTGGLISAPDILLYCVL